MLRVLFASLALCLSGVMALPAFAFDPAQLAARDSDVALYERYDELIAESQENMMGAPDKALALARQAEVVLESALETPRRNEALATTLWLEAEALNRMRQPKEAEPLIGQAIELLGDEPEASKLLGDLSLVQGRVSQALGDVQTALASYLSAHEVFQVVGEDRSRTIALLKVGDIYNEAHDFARAINYYTQATDAFQDDATLRMVTLNNLGNAYRGIEDFSAAEESYRAALAVAETFESPMLEARILTNIASAQLKAGAYEAADVTADLGLALTDGETATGWEPFLFGVKAEAAFRTGEVRKAVTLVQRTFDGQDLTTTPMPFRDFHETAYVIYDAAGRSKSALEHLAAFKRLDDEALSVAASASSALMSAQFDFANQELRIEQLRRGQLERDVALAQAEARQQRFLFGSVTLIVVIILGFVLAGYRSVRKSRDQIRAANEELSRTNVALEKANAAKTEFLATTSHEIRTPLNGILGMTQVMLGEKRLAKKHRERLEVVSAAGNTMKAIVDDILDVSKIETGKVTLETGEFDLQATILEVTRLWQDQAEDKKIKFDVDLEACPQIVDGDQKRFRQIVFNLLSNAVKFTEAGSIRTIARTEERDGQQHLVFVVEDTGIGIPEDEFENIFKSFHQVEGSRSRRFAGTGLGLAICRNLSRAMGGDVTVRSELDQGSAFTLDMPVDVVRMSLADEQARALPETAADAHLLALEPNMIEQFVLEASLAPNFARVCVVGDEDALRTEIEAGTFDLVVWRAVDAKLRAPELKALTDRPLSAICVSENPADAVETGADATLAGELEAFALIGTIEGLMSNDQDSIPDEGTSGNKEQAA